MSDITVLLSIGWTKSEHADGKRCRECEEVIGLLGKTGYAPCFVMQGKIGGIVGPCLDTFCYCDGCIHDEWIAVDVT